MLRVEVMTTSAFIIRPRFRTLAGTVTTLALLAGIALAGAVAVLTAIAVAGAVTGGLFAWSRASARRPLRH